MIRFGTLLLHRGPGFIGNAAEFFRCGSNLVGSRADIADGVLDFHYEGIETPPELCKFVATFVRQAVTEIALTLGDVLHHGSNGVQRFRHRTTYKHTDEQCDDDHNHGYQNNKTESFSDLSFNIRACGRNYFRDIGDIHTGPDHPAPIGNNRGK